MVTAVLDSLTVNVTIRLRGSGVARVLDLIDRGLLKYEIVKTGHHGNYGNRLDAQVIKVLGEHDQLCLALVYATSLNRRVIFKEGHAVDIDTERHCFVLGVDCDPAVAVRLIAGSDFSVSPGTT